MEITFETSGGFIGGTTGTVTVDTAQLEATLAQRLDSLVHAAEFFDQPVHTPAPPPGAADYQSYRITVRDGLRSHCIERTDPIADDAIAQLVLALEGLAAALRRRGD